MQLPKVPILKELARTQFLSKTSIRFRKYHTAQLPQKHPNPQSNSRNQGVMIRKNLV